MKRKSKRDAANLCGKRVKLSRIAKDMNQLQLATALSVDFDIDVNQYSVSLLERGKRFVKDYEIIALAEILDVSPLWLLYGDDVPDKRK